MPKTTFLEATEPKVKASKIFRRLDNGRLEKESFPNIYKVTSHTHEFNNIDELHNLIKIHAALGMTLLKGNPVKQLVNESRAGSTRSQDSTQVLVLDLDGLPGVKTTEEAIKKILPPEFQDVSYTWHPSSSAGIDKANTLSAHVFFILDKPIPAPLIKEWLIYQNLTNDTLKNALKLSRTGVTLLYALDVSADQNDKLIYIAPPTCENFDDPLPERHHLVTKTHGTVSLEINNIPPLRDLVDTAVNNLRVAAGLKRKKANYKDDILINPEPTTFIESKHERGFVYGGFGIEDSTAYWYPEDNPRILYNFKGAPPMYLRDVDPTYYRQIQQRNKKYLVFRDRLTDTYYNGFYNEEQNEVDIKPCGAKDRLSDFMRQYGLSVPDPITDWELYFDPHEENVIDFPGRRINQYKKSPIIRVAEALEPVTECPQVIYDLLHHALGNCDRSLKRFLNYCAFIIQKRTKPQTAWIMHGIQGTGKGLFYSRVMQPIIGEEFVTMKEIRHLRDQFNEYMEKCLLCVFDECDMEEVNADRVMSTLKTMITEPTQTIRRMRTNPYKVPSYTAFLFFSNKEAVVQIENDDRRFNVPPRQETRLIYTEAMGDAIDRATVDFASFLLNYPVDVRDVARVEETDAKKTMRDSSTTSLDLFFKALKDQNLMYFLEYYNEEISGNPGAFYNFQKTLDAWCQNINTTSVVTRSELLHAYTFIQNVRGTAPSKFERMLHKYNIKLKTLPTTKGPVRGVHVKWHIPSEHIDIFKPLLEKSYGNT